MGKGFIFFYVRTFWSAAPVLAILYGFTRFEWCTHPAMCVWLVVVVVCVCDLGEVGVGGYVCGCWGMGGGQVGHIAVIICIMDFFFFFYPVCVFIVISLNAFDVTLMFFLHVAK